MSSRNVHVRVTPETLLQLTVLRQDLSESVSMGKGVRFWHGEELTTAELIRELVRRELEHRRRSRESAARRKESGRKGRAADQIPATATGVNTSPGIEEAYELEDWYAMQEAEAVRALAEMREPGKPLS